MSMGQGRGVVLLSETQRVEWKRNRVEGSIATNFSGRDKQVRILGMIARFAKFSSSFF